MSSKTRIVLSPHYDDAALSCGGALAQLRDAGEPTLVATIFGGKPDYADLSPFAQTIHARPLAEADLIEQRRKEEARALRVLGAPGVAADFLDAIYRRDPADGRWLYDSEAALFGAVDAADEPLVEEIARWVAALSHPAACILIVPLAIGEHVDHQVVQRAALLLEQFGYSLHYFEDYPYIARRPEGLEERLTWLAQSDRRQPEHVILPPAVLQRKADAVMAYTSQLEMLFPGDGDLRGRVLEALEAQAYATGEQIPAERYWETWG
ncbi:MAG: PIG-L family deacetylase [Anaerolineae bacterium]